MNTRIAGSKSFFTAILLFRGGSNLQKDFDRSVLEWIYERLIRTFGKRHWWPAETPFEIVIGAILTQGTAWSNVEKAIRALREKKYLDAQSLYHLDEKILAKTIRSSGFFNVKAKRLKNFLAYFFERCSGDLKKMFQIPTPTLRRELLAIAGLGEETTDSILLYAGEKMTFVVDGYTRRIFSRHGLLDGKEEYDNIQNYFMNSLPHRSALFNEYHALLVEVGKRHCRNTPLCRGCPLDPLPRTKKGCEAFMKKQERKI